MKIEHTSSDKDIYKEQNLKTMNAPNVFIYNVLCNFV